MVNVLTELWDLLENPVFSILFTIIILITVGIFFKGVWIFLFSIIVSYMLTDIILNFIVRGESGYAKIPVLGHHFQTKGHSYIAYIVGIVIGTFFASELADNILIYLKSFTDWNTIVITSSFIVGILVFLDFESRFFD